MAESSPLGPRGSLTLQTWVPLTPAAAGGSQHLHMSTIFWSRHPVSFLFFVPKALTAVTAKTQMLSWVPVVPVAP